MSRAAWTREHSMFAWGRQGGCDRTTHRANRQDIAGWAGRAGAAMKRYLTPAEHERVYLLDVGKAFAAAREAAGLQQVELSRRSGVSERQIRLLERGSNASLR